MDVKQNEQHLRKIIDTALFEQVLSMDEGYFLENQLVFLDLPLQEYAPFYENSFQDIS